MHKQLGNRTAVIYRRRGKGWADQAAERTGSDSQVPDPNTHY